MIVTKMSLFRLRRRQHRKSRKPAEAAARCRRDLRATAAGGITSASPGTKEAGTLRTQRGRQPRKVAAPRVVAMTIEKMVEGRCLYFQSATMSVDRGDRSYTRSFVTRQKIALYLEVYGYRRASAHHVAMTSIFGKRAIAILTNR